MSNLLWEDRDRALTIVTTADGTAGRVRFEISCGATCVSVTTTQLVALARGMSTPAVVDAVRRYLPTESVI